MNAVNAYLDTNLLVYLYSDTEPEKRKKILETINQYERIVSTQVLNEFCNVCIRKMKVSTSEIVSSIEKICLTCKVVIVQEATVLIALRINKKYGYSYYDSLMIASALESGCTYLFSEDMSDGQVIENRLTIRNIL